MVRINFCLTLMPKARVKTHIAPYNAVCEITSASVSISALLFKNCKTGKATYFCRGLSIPDEREQLEQS